MERVLPKTAPRALVVPLMARGATDGAFLRQKGMAVYGVPIFLWGSSGIRLHGNDECIPLTSLEAGTKLLEQIVLAVAGSR